MKLSENCTTAGASFRISAHIYENTDLHIDTNLHGGLAIHLGDLTIFMERDDAHLFADAIQDYLDRTESDAADAIY